MATEASPVVVDEELESSDHPVVTVDVFVRGWLVHWISGKERVTLESWYVPSPLRRVQLGAASLGLVKSVVFSVVALLYLSLHDTVAVVEANRQQHKTASCMLIRKTTIFILDPGNDTRNYTVLSSELFAVTGIHGLGIRRLGLVVLWLPAAFYVVASPKSL
jgi:hypothetical protein